MIDLLIATSIILSLLAASLTASLLTRLKIFAQLGGNSNSRYSTIDGIRGFLALMVFFAHYIVTFYWKTDGVWTQPDEAYINNLGVVGVSIFFIITGFLFTGKILKGQVNWKELYISRVYRIYPLYLFALAIISFYAFKQSNFGLDDSFIKIAKQYFYWIIYYGVNINGFNETRTVIAGVDWTLKYEWIFYLTLPLLLTIVKSGRIAVVILSAVTVLLYIQPQEVGRFNSKYFVLFLIGGLTYKIVTILPPYVILKAQNSRTSVVAVILTILTLVYPSTFDAFHITAISGLFLLIACGNSLFGTIATRSSLVLGEISYSLYLTHGIVLYTSFTEFSTINFSSSTLDSFVLYMPLLSVVTVLLATLTYQFIENPFMTIARNRLKKK